MTILHFQEPFLLVLIPVLAALVIFLMTSTLKKNAGAIVIGTLILWMIQLVMVLIQWGGHRWIYDVGGWFPMEGIALELHKKFMWEIGVVFLPAIVFYFYTKSKINRRAPEEKNIILGLWLLCLASLVGMLLSDDLMNLFMEMELFFGIAGALFLIDQHDTRVFKWDALLLEGSALSCFWILGLGFFFIKEGEWNQNNFHWMRPLLAHSQVILIALGLMMIGSLKLLLLTFHDPSPKRKWRALLVIPIWFCIEIQLLEMILKQLYF